MEAANRVCDRNLVKTLILLVTLLCFSLSRGYITIDTEHSRNINEGSQQLD